MTKPKVEHFFSQELSERAFRLHVRYARRLSPFFDQPARDSIAYRFEGSTYVVLENVHGILGVYRYFPNGDRMQRLERWPDEVTIASGNEVRERA